MIPIKTNGTFAEAIASFPASVQTLAKKLRKLIAEIYPDATEVSTGSRLGRVATRPGHGAGRPGRSVPFAPTEVTNIAGNRDDSDSEGEIEG